MPYLDEVRVMRIAFGVWGKEVSPAIYHAERPRMVAKGDGCGSKAGTRVIRERIDHEDSRDFPGTGYEQ